MPLTPRACLAALVAGGFICTGCQGRAPTAIEPQASQPAPAGDLVQPPPIPTPTSPAVPRTGLPGSLRLNLEQGNKDGVKVKVTQITFQPSQIVVELAATNASPDPVALAGSPFTGMTLVDDKGNSYNFQAPERNRALRVAPGQDYSGKVIFLGALADDASLLTLTTNAGSSGDHFVPRFEFANIAVEAP